MNFLFLSTQYINWHYSVALQSGKQIFLNLLWFVYHFFSIGDLLKTLFLPWRRLSDERKGNFSLEDVAGTFLVNTLMRFFGALLRVSVIFMGIISLLVLLFLSIIFFIIWIFYPVIILTLFMLSFLILF